LKTTLIIPQRHNRYDGEYGPEIIDAVDEFTDEENPDYLQEKFEQTKKSSEFDRVTLLQIEIPDEAIKNALYPESKTVRITPPNLPN